MKGKAVGVAELVADGDKANPEVVGSIDGDALGDFGSSTVLAARSGILVAGTQPANPSKTTQKTI